MHGVELPCVLSIHVPHVCKTKAGKVLYYISYVAFIVSLNIKICAEMGIRP